MSHEIKKINELYDVILSNRKIISEIMLKVSEVEVNYPHLKFADRTLNDSLPKSLLDDLNSAAKSIGAIVTIDYAKTGHDRYADSGYESRHWRRAAVDIDYIIIGGKSYVVSPQNREVVEKFTNVLEAMGYTKNAEGRNNPKAFLTFGFDGHDDHVHVSNLTDSSSSTTPDTGSSTTPDDSGIFGNPSEILDKTIFKGMTPEQKTEAIEKLKSAGLWAGIVAGGIGLISLLPKIQQTLKGTVDKVTDDSKYGGNQDVNMTAEYVGNLIKAALPF